MKKTHKIVMVPLNREQKENEEVIFNEYWLPSYLYVLSDDDIKEGDWCINANNRIVQFRSSVRNKESCKKIIATTDTSLKECISECTNDWATENDHAYIPLPQIPQDFINKFIESYNTGKVIEEVEIEYVMMYRDLSGKHEALMLKGDEFAELKINPDNTISIHSVKDTFTREELQFFKGSSGNHLEWIFERLVHKHGEDPNYDYMIKLKELSNWIKENL